MPLVSVIPLRVRLQQGKVSIYIQSCQTSITRLIPYEHVPLGAIQRWLGVPALIDVLFSIREESPPNDYECLEYIPFPLPPPEVRSSHSPDLSHASPRPSQFPIVFEIVVNPARDTVEFRSVVAVNEEVVKTVLQLLDEFESCVTYLSESPDDELSLPKSGNRSSAGRSIPRPQAQGAEPADPHVVQIVISELCTFLRLPAENVREESLLFSLGLDSLKAVTLSRRLRERGISVSPIDIIQAGSIHGVASSSAIVGKQDISSQEEYSFELERLLEQDLPVESVRLGEDDHVKITAATALQAGMLSQVGVATIFWGVITAY